VPAPGRSLSPDARRILFVQALRAFAYGLGSVIVGVSLARLGLGALVAGAVVAALQAGTVLATIAVGRLADRFGRRRSYALLLVLMAAAGGAFALSESPYLLVAAALTGTVSTDVVESGPFTSLEQAMLPAVADLRGTASLFASYNGIATVAGSFGALAAAAPSLVDGGRLAEPARWLLAYPVAAGLALLVARHLSEAVEVPRTPAAAPSPPLRESRHTIRRLGALFALDSFGGGFVVQTFIAFWLTRRFDASPSLIGALFFGIGLLQAGSFHAAARLAARIGLLRTMVFTHLPSNLLLVAVAFAPTLPVAVALLLTRFALSQMDVPARQAYVVALVPASERTAATAYTNAARSLPRPLAPLLAGAAARLGLGAPFLVAGLLKGVYDVGLYLAFRGVDVDPRSRRPRVR
jgi:MFS family permease